MKAIHMSQNGINGCVGGITFDKVLVCEGYFPLQVEPCPSCMSHMTLCKWMAL